MEKEKTKTKKKTKSNAWILIAPPSNPSRPPFSDLSNATPDSTSNPNPNPKHLQPQPQSDRHDFRSQTEILSTSTSTTSRHFAAAAAASSSSATMAPPSDPRSGRGGCNLLSLSEQTTVYRRKTASRIEHTQNAASNDALSCPPRRTKTEEKKGKKSKKDDNNDTHRLVSSAPCKRRKKPENFTLPEDFVREQRDYFAKLDEEELIVEEAEKEPFQYLDESKDKVNQSEDG